MFVLKEQLYEVKKQPLNSLAHSPDYMILKVVCVDVGIIDIAMLTKMFHKSCELKIIHTMVQDRSH